jgi:hypothetical protein
MRRLNQISTSEISQRINATTNRLLGHHVGLSAIFEHSRLGVSCLVCGGRWTVVEGPCSGDGLELMLTTHGDGYCEEGATDYFDSSGKVMQRI